MKNILRTTLVFLTGLILATGLFEVFLRATEHFPDKRFLPIAQASFYNPDSETGYGLRPNSKGYWDTENRAYIEINSLGYRGQEPEKSGADIVFAGHSLTEALQVEENKTFTYLVGKDLNTTTANLGISGAPPALVLTRLQKFVPILKPKTIVITVESRFFEQPSVLQDSGHIGYKISADGSTAELSQSFRQSRGYKIRTSKLGDILYWALDNFRIANILNNTLNRGLFKALHDLRTSTVIKAERKTIGTKESFFNLWTQNEPKNHSLALKAFLSGLNDLQQQYKTKVIIAITGPWEDANPDTVKAIDKAMETMTNRHGVRIVNLTPYIQANYPNKANLVAFRGFHPPWRGGHLNETGHQIYAKAIIDLLSE